MKELSKLTVVKLAVIPIYDKIVVISMFKISKTKFIIADNGTNEDCYISELLTKYLVKYWSRVKYFLLFDSDLKLVLININPPWAKTNVCYKLNNGMYSIGLITWDNMGEDEEYDVSHIGYFLRHELYHMFISKLELGIDSPIGWGLELSLSRHRKNILLSKESIARRTRYKPVSVSKIPSQVPQEFIFMQLYDKEWLKRLKENQ